VYLPEVRELPDSARTGDFCKAHACTTEKFPAKVPIDRFLTALEEQLDIRHAKVGKLEFAGSSSDASGV
jgi:hypothetical protein